MRTTRIFNKSSTFLSLLFFLLLPSIAHCRVTTLEIIGVVIKNQNTDEFAKTSGIGQDICRANGRPSYDCGSYVSLAQGICLASNRPSYDCGSYINLNQAICLSTGRPSYDCSSYISIVQALCLARGRASYECNSYMTAENVFAMPVQDVSWAWDLFANQYGDEQWVCRGKNTGEFSDLEKCSTNEKIDSTWPGKRLER